MLGVFLLVGYDQILTPLADNWIQAQKINPEGKEYLKEQTQGPSAINRRVTIRNITPLLNGGQASLPPPPPGIAPPR